MNDADRKAFQAWADGQHTAKTVQALQVSAWQAACEWRDSQSPTAQINQQLVNVLQDIAATGYSNIDRDKARTALAAVKNAQEKQP